MKKFNEKMDEYFNEKFKKDIESDIICRFNLEVKFTENKEGSCELLVKPPEYKDEHWACIFAWSKENAFEKMLNYNDFRKFIIEILDIKEWK